MAFRFGDVLLVPIVFSEGSGAKKRPVLTVHDAGDLDLLVVPITSHPSRGSEDVIVVDWRAAGLRLPSTVRMSKLPTVAKSTVIRKLEKLTENEARQAQKVLRRFFEAIF